MKEIKIEELKINPFTLIGKEWCLIGAKYNNKFNAMTASWGGVGVLWNKNVITVYIRPQRYTNEFVNASDHFTVSFFDESYKDALKVYGSKSGRDINKEEATGLHLEEKDAYTYFKEAKLVLQCKKLYCGKIEADGFMDPEVDFRNYPNKDYHYVYIGEIEKVLGDQL